MIHDGATMKELRFARKVIRQLKRETNQFDSGRVIANKALRRLDAFINRNSTTQRN